MAVGLVVGQLCDLRIRGAMSDIGVLVPLDR